MKKTRPSVTWPRGPFEWIEDGILHVSVPFTWNLPEVQRRIASTWMTVRVGGPAVDLMPTYLRGAEIGRPIPGVLQRINPLATRTTIGCPSKCGFCGIGNGRIEPGGFREIPHFIPGPVICDNNLLAASGDHLGRVFRMLKTFGWADFNQGLDASLMTEDIARLINDIGKPIVRLSLDSASEIDAWGRAYELLRSAGIAKIRILTYVLIGFLSDPGDAWKRCEIVEQKKYGTVLPMWFNRLDALTRDTVTEEQKTFGWSEEERDRIMGFYWQHRGKNPERGE